MNKWDEAHCDCDGDLEFQCVTGGCVGAGWKCDGEADCFDGSDEAPALCSVAPTTPGKMGWVGGFVTLHVMAIAHMSAIMRGCMLWP